MAGSYAELASRSIGPGSSMSPEQGCAPGDMAKVLRARRTVRSRDGKGWEGIMLERLSDLPPRIEVPAMRDTLLTFHLAGPFLAETGLGTPAYERRWIGPGELGISPAGSPLRRDIKGRPEVVLIHISSELLQAIAAETFDTESGEVELVPKLSEADATAEHLIGLLLREAESTDPCTSVMVESLSRALVVHLLRNHSNLSVRRAEAADSISPGRVKRVIDYMHEHLDEPMPLAELAAVGRLSVSRFVRAFHAAVGKPPHRFLIQLRIEEACRLLETSELSVTEIGLRCGFDQPSHFASMFRTIVGMPPSAWRRERQG